MSAECDATTLKYTASSTQDAHTMHTQLQLLLRRRCVGSRAFGSGGKLAGTSLIPARRQKAQEHAGIYSRGYMSALCAWRSIAAFRNRS